MERGNFFSRGRVRGPARGKQGIYGNLQRLPRDVASAKSPWRALNFANVLAHFSHSGVDDMADKHLPLRHQNSMFARWRA